MRTPMLRESLQAIPQHWFTRRVPIVVSLTIGVVLVAVAIAVAQFPSPTTGVAGRQADLSGAEQLDDLDDGLDLSAERGYDQSTPPMQGDPGPASVRSLPQAEKKDDRIREGTELENQEGVFRPTGDRITFFTEMGKGRFLVLENLALDRIARVITENPSKLKWLVTGKMTEYQGMNYLLVERAVLKTQLQSDEPDF